MYKKKIICIYIHIQYIYKFYKNCYKIKLDIIEEGKEFINVQARKLKYRKI